MKSDIKVNSIDLEVLLKKRKEELELKVKELTAQLKEENKELAKIKQLLRACKAKPKRKKKSNSDVYTYTGPDCGGYPSCRGCDICRQGPEYR